MKVYVAETGQYSDRVLANVYDTPERAMAALPGKVRKHHHWRGLNSWTNNCNFDSAGVITEQEVITEGPTQDTHGMRG